MATALALNESITKVDLSFNKLSDDGLMNLARYERSSRARAFPPEDSVVNCTHTRYVMMIEAACMSHHGQQSLNAHWIWILS